MIDETIMIPVTEELPDAVIIVQRRHEYDFDVLETLEFAIRHHGGQKYGDRLYAYHLVWVARKFQDPKRQVVALLHDIVEDTDVSLSRIEKRYGQYVALVVDHLTRRHGELYLQDYIERVAKSPTATQIKLADLACNIHHAESVYQNYQRLLPRYYAARDRLERVLKGY